MNYQYLTNIILGSTISMYTIVECKKLVLVVEPLIYKACIKWVYQTYNETTPL